MNLRERLEQDLLELEKEWRDRADNLYKNGESDDTAQYNYLGPAKVKAAILYGCIQSLSKLMASRGINEESFEARTTPLKSYFATPDGRQRFTGAAMAPGAEPPSGCDAAFKNWVAEKDHPDTIAASFGGGWDAGIKWANWEAAAGCAPPQAEQPAISHENSLIQKAEAFGRWYEGQQTVPAKPIDLARSAWWAALDWLVTR